MKYLKLPEVNHKDYNYNCDEFQDFKTFDKRRV